MGGEADGGRRQREQQLLRLQRFAIATHEQAGQISVDLLALRCADRGEHISRSWQPRIVRLRPKAPQHQETSSPDEASIRADERKRIAAILPSLIRTGLDLEKTLQYRIENAATPPEPKTGEMK